MKSTELVTIKRPEKNPCWLTEIVNRNFFSIRFSKIDSNIFPKNGQPEICC